MGTTSPQQFQFLRTGRRYRVIREFVDFDGQVHPVDEAWTFLGFNFVPYEDGMSFFVSPDGTAQRQIRLRWCPDAQGEVLDRLADYFADE